MNNPKKAQVDGWPVQTWIRHYPNDDDLPRLGSLVFAAAVSTKPGAAQPRLSSVQASWTPALRICWQLGTEDSRVALARGHLAGLATHVISQSAFVNGRSSLRFCRLTQRFSCPRNSSQRRQRTRQSWYTRHCNGFLHRHAKALCSTFEAPFS